MKLRGLLFSSLPLLLGACGAQVSLRVSVIPEGAANGQYLATSAGMRTGSRYALAVQAPVGTYVYALRGPADGARRIFPQQGDQRIGSSGEALLPESYLELADRPPADQPVREVLWLVAAGRPLDDGQVRQAILRYAAEHPTRDSDDGKRKADDPKKQSPPPQAPTPQPSSSGRDPYTVKGVLREDVAVLRFPWQHEG